MIPNSSKISAPLLHYATPLADPPTPQIRVIEERERSTAKINRIIDEIKSISPISLVSSSFPLLELPTTIITIIFKKLDPDTQSSLALTSKRIYAITQKSLQMKKKREIEATIDTYVEILENATLLSSEESREKVLQKITEIKESLSLSPQASPYSFTKKEASFDISRRILAVQHALTQAFLQLENEDLELVEWLTDENESPHQEYTHMPALFTLVPTIAKFNKIKDGEHRDCEKAAFCFLRAACTQNIANKVIAMAMTIQNPLIGSRILSKIALSMLEHPETFRIERVLSLAHVIPDERIQAETLFHTIYPLLMKGKLSCCIEALELINHLSDAIEIEEKESSSKLQALVRIIDFGLKKAQKEDRTLHEPTKTALQEKKVELIEALPSERLKRMLMRNLRT